MTMDRRRYLATLLGGVVAGCRGATEQSTDGSPPTRAEDSPKSAPITGADGTPSGICRKDPRPGRIPAIIEPAFAPNWDGVSGRSELTESTPIIGIQRAGEVRAYPLPVLRHEIVNDAFDVPVVVTYCPLCASGLTGIRTVYGSETTFGNTSFTWRPPGAAGQEAIESGSVFGISYRDRPDQTTPRNDPNLVMFDTETGSFWSQLLARAICGPLTGEPLSFIPSTVTNWGEWRATHPETTVLLPPPHSTLMTE